MITAPQEPKDRQVRLAQLEAQEPLEQPVSLVGRARQEDKEVQAQLAASVAPAALVALARLVPLEPRVVLEALVRRVRLERLVELVAPEQLEVSEQLEQQESLVETAHQARLAPSVD